MKALKTLNEEIKILTALTPATKKEKTPLTPEPAADIDLYTSILIWNCTTIVQTVVIITNLIQKTALNLNYILKTLFPQDLSSQCIKKIVPRISDIQTRLLVILNSVNTKIKVHQESDKLKIKSTRTEKITQNKRDKILGKLRAIQINKESQLLDPGMGISLTQNAVNDLLTNLDF